MIINFSTAKLQKCLENKKEMVRKYGEEQAKKISQRLLEIAAAPTLKDLVSLPTAKCHGLIGKRINQYAVSLSQPYRLIFLPKFNNELIENEVTEVTILEIIDYH